MARGPIIYCVEDVDNAWVKDHFKSVQLDAACTVQERLVVDDPATGDTYVALKVTRGASLLRTADVHAYPAVEVGALDKLTRCEDRGAVIEELNFVPYYFRANRGGRGQARVGLRRWHRETEVLSAPKL